MEDQTKYEATMAVLEDYFRKHLNTVATGLSKEYCEDLWDKLVFCPYELTLHKEYVLFKNPYIRN
jgi:hypothetical protein